MLLIGGYGADDPNGTGPGKSDGSEKSAGPDKSANVPGLDTQQNGLSAAANGPGANITCRGIPHKQTIPDKSIRRGVPLMTAEALMDESAILTVITMIIQEHKCWLKDFDYKNRVLDIDGPSDDALMDCALALEMKLGEYLV